VASGTTGRGHTGFTKAQRQAMLSAGLVAVAAFVVANVVETGFITLVDAGSGELLWISDVVLAAALGLATYLWLSLLATRATLSRLEREQLVLETQLSIAAEIQRRLLPELPREASGLRWAARLEPAGKIGGDFYDFVSPEVGRQVMLVGDISGKGIPAALLLAFARTVFRLAAEQTNDPARIASLLSHAVYQDNQGAPYVTALICSIDAAARTLIYTNAGHPPGVILRRQGTEHLDVGGPPAGLLPDARYESASLHLAPGDAGILMTDGVSEALALDLLPLERVVERVARGSGGPRTPGGLCDALILEARRRGGPTGVEGWADDRTVVAFVVA
jgi:hypothetical protein